MDDASLELYRHTTELRNLRGMWEWLALTRGPSSARMAAAAGGAGVCAMLSSQRHVRELEEELERSGGVPPSAYGVSSQEPPATMGVGGGDDRRRDAPGDETTVPRACGPFQAYHRASRVAALRLCGWAVDNADGGVDGGRAGAGGDAGAGADPVAPAHGALDELITRCERTGRGDRAVAMAVWHGHLRKAVKSLDRGYARRMEAARKLARDATANGGKVSGGVAARIDAATKDAEMLQLVAMALAGYPNQRDGGTLPPKPKGHHGAISWPTSCY